MRISRMRVSNFKRLRDFDLDFAAGGSNLAFVNGTNGNGKTTLLSAFRWVFFGEKIDAESYSYSSLKLLTPGDSSEITASISLSDVEDGNLITISRTQPVECVERQGSNEVVFAGLEDLLVTRIYGDPTIPTEVIPDPEAWLEQHLPNRFKKFILFDGELMFKFFDTSVKGAIEEAVREIAKIDFFDATVESLREVSSKYTKKIARLSGTAAEKLEAEISKIDELALGIESDLRLQRQSLVACRAEIKELEVLLRGKETLKGFLEKNKELRESLSAARETAKELDNRLSKNVFSAGISGLILSRVSYPLRKHVSDAEKSGKYPADFSTSALQELLEEGVCICGHSLDESSPGFNKVSQLIAISENAGQLGNALKQIELGVLKSAARFEASAGEREFLIDQRRETSKQIKNLEAEIAKLEPSLEGARGSHDEIREASSKLKRLQAEEIQFVRAETSLATKLIDAKELRAETFKKFERAKASSAEVRELSRVLEGLNKAISEAESFADEVIETVRYQIAESITSKFRKVQGCSGFTVEISNDFDVIALNEIGRQPELAEGQKMALAYLFSISLREVVGLNFPLIVDTPLGRVASANKRVVADALCELAGAEDGHQVILMMHDGEYTPYAKRDFAKISPYETYLALSEDNFESTVREGIDPDWLTRDAWKDYAEGRIVL